jgi:tetratricopeptide (TPR) repeat protein
VFAGGWTAEAAEEVAGAGSLDKAAVLEQLTQLVEKSLAVMDASGERYRLLDTVRHYAQERLEESRDADEARERHLQFYLGLAEKARPELAGAKQGEWLARLDLERENLLAAHAWCDRAPHGAEHGLTLAYLLRPYWLNRGLLGLGYRFTEEALNRSGAGARDFARSRGLFIAGQFSLVMGRYDEARRSLEESVQIAREIGDPRRVAAALQPLGMAHAGQGDLPTARRYLEEAVALAEQQGQQREVAAAGNALAQLCRVEGDLARAEALYAQVLALMRKLEDRESIAIVLLNLAMVAIGRGDGERARIMLLEVLAIADEIGSKPVGQSLFEVSAGLAALREEWPRVARFYGAAEVQAAQTGLRRDPGDEAFLAPLLARARAALGAPGFSAADGAGRELPFEQAIAETRTWLGEARPA